MTLAWGTIVAMLLLLPGFMAFTGLYASEGFSRDTTPKSRVAQLAAIVLIAFLAHALLLLLLKLCSSCGCAWCDVSVATAIQTMLGPSDAPGGISAKKIAHSIDQHAGLIVLYVITSVGLGFLGGWVLGRTLQGPLRALLQHKWIYAIAPPSGENTGAAPYAYVMTTTMHEERVLCYSGPVLDFSLDRDGRFSYLVLRGASRFYMVLGDEKPMTGESVQIGHDHSPDKTHDNDRLYLDGVAVQNVVFDTYTFKVPAKLKTVLQQFDEIVRKALEAAAT